MESAPRQMNSTDFMKVVQAFGWNFASLVVSAALAVLALPEAELPSWLLWLVPLAPALNALLYGVKRYLADNRKS